MACSDWTTQQNAARQAQAAAANAACDAAFAADLVVCNTQQAQRLATCDNIQCNSFGDCAAIQCTSFTDCDALYGRFDPRRYSCYVQRDFCVAGKAIERTGCWALRGACVGLAAIERGACVAASALVYGTALALAAAKYASCKAGVFIADTASAGAITIAAGACLVLEFVLGGPTVTTATTNQASNDNEIEVLVDNQVAFERVLDSIKRARVSIWISQLAFEPDCVATYQPLAVGTPAQPIDLLVDALAEKQSHVDRGFNVPVKILTCGTLPHMPHSLQQVFADRGIPAARISVRGVDVPSPQMLHSKMVLIDGQEGFIVGSPFDNPYWDTTSHDIVEPRRPRGSMLGGFDGRPVHDVSLRITGHAVDDLEDQFVELWNWVDRKSTNPVLSVGVGIATGVAIGAASGLLFGPFVATTAMAIGTVVGALAGGAKAANYGGHDQLSPHRATIAGRARQAVQIVRTAPANYLPSLPGGATGVLEAYTQALAGARSFIYIENQYATSTTIFAALEAALDRNPALELILLINEHPDIPGYKQAQNARLTGFAMRPNVGIFSLWKASPPTATRAHADINQIYIHAKSAIIDDNWATIGTANLDGFSLDSATGAAFDNKRFFETNAVLLDGVAERPATGNVAAMRRRLWSEHLGLSEATLINRPRGGWLGLWRDTAARNVTSLQSGAPSMSGNILPHSAAVSATDELNDLGINTDPGRLHVLV